MWQVSLTLMVGIVVTYITIVQRLDENNEDQRQERIEGKTTLVHVIGKDGKIEFSNIDEMIVEKVTLLEPGQHTISTLGNVNIEKITDAATGKQIICIH